MARRLKKNMSCPSGFKDGNACVQIVDAQKPTCPEGYTLGENACVMTKTENPTCPAGYTLVGTVCNKKGSMKCPLGTQFFGEGDYPCCKLYSETDPSPCNDLLTAINKAADPTYQPKYKPGIDQDGTSSCCQRAL